MQLHLKNKLLKVDLLGRRIYVIRIMIDMCITKLPSKDAVSVYKPPRVSMFPHPHINTENCFRLTACSGDNMEDDLDGKEPEKRK